MKANSPDVFLSNLACEDLRARLAAAGNPSTCGRPALPKLSAAGVRVQRFDSSRFLIFWGGIPRPMWKFSELSGLRDS